MKKILLLLSLLIGVFAHSQDIPIFEYFESLANSDYGDVVSIQSKKKMLVKFGKNVDIDTGAEELIWGGDGKEVLLTSNGINTISSSNAGYTQTIRIEGHTVDGNGNFSFVVQNVTLNGQNKVTLSTPLARSTRSFNTSGTDLLGTVYIYEDTAITSGVPNDLTKAHLTINVGENQSLKAASTISNNDYYFVTGLVFSVKKTTSATVDFKFQVKQKGGVWRTQIPITVSSTNNTVSITPPNAVLVIHKNSDFRVIASTTANNTEATAIVIGYLGSVLN